MIASWHHHIRCIELLPEARVGSHGYSSRLVCYLGLLPEARVGGHGYSSLLVCLSVQF